MAIQMRRGLQKDFDPNKMLAGEWAVTIDNDTDKQIVYMCFGAGIVKRMGTWDDLEKELDPYKEATQAYCERAEVAAENAEASAEAAATSESNSQTIYNRVEQMTQRLDKALVPMGTIEFAALPALADAQIGDMYNISNDFVTTADFVEGAGVAYGAGANVYKIATDKWDVAAGVGVTGIKGSNEMMFRHGDVSISAEDLGLEDVATWALYSQLAGTPTFGVSNADSDIEISITPTTTQREKKKTIGGIEFGQFYTQTIYTISAKLKQSATNFLSKVNPKGIGKFSVGHDTLAYGSGSHAEGGYSTSTSTTSCTVTSIEIAGNVATIGLNFSSEISLRTLWYRSISRTTTRDVLYRSIEVKSSTGGTTVTNKYSDFVVKYFLETDEQKADISNVAVGDTLYLCYGGTSAIGNCSHAEGYNTSAIGSYSHAEGTYTTASVSVSHAEGSSTVASGQYSHAEGYSTVASSNSSHAEGYSTTASGLYSHAEGSDTTASGSQSHVEGTGSSALSQYSHAEGYNTIANGFASHSGGGYTNTSGSYSHAQNYYTSAKGHYQTAIGKYNVEDTTSALIVGNGSSTERSNAMTLDFSGNMVLAGTVDAQGFTINGEPISSGGGATGERQDLPIYRVTLSPTSTSAATYALTIDDFKAPCMLIVDVADDASANYASLSSSNPFTINTKKCYYTGVAQASNSSGTTRSVGIYKKSYGGNTYYKQRLFLVSENKYSADYPYQAFDTTPYYDYSNSYPSSYNVDTSTTMKSLTGADFRVSTTDLTAGSSTLTTGQFYFVYE